MAPLVYLANDDPDGARQHVVGSIAHWAQRGFLIQHWRAMVAEVDIYLYEGKGALAYERLARHEREFRRSLLSFAQYIRVVTRFARARSAVASVRDTGRLGRERLREASRIGRRLEREGTPWISVLGSLVAASVSNAEGRREDACSNLRAASEQARAADMALHEWAARHRLGRLLGGDEGCALVAEAEAQMRSKGVHAPDRYASMLLPGAWGATGEVTASTVPPRNMFPV